MTTLITPKGLVVLNVPNRYTIQSVLSIPHETLNSFLSLLNVSRGPQQLYDLFTVLDVNNLLEAPDKNIYSNPNFRYIIDRRSLLEDLAKLGLEFSDLYSAIVIILPLCSWISDLSKNRIITPVSLVPSVVPSVVPVVPIIAPKLVLPVPKIVPPIQPTQLAPAQKPIQPKIPDPAKGDPRTLDVNYPIDTKALQINNGKNNTIDGRDQIRKIMIETQFHNNPNFNKLTKENLQKIFELYDLYVFGGRIQGLLNIRKSIINFVVSSRMTKTAGRCAMNGCSYEIKVSSTLFINLFTHSNKPIVTHGITCYNRLDCMMVTFEHELTHLVIFMSSHRPHFYKGIPNDKNKDDKDTIWTAHGKLFSELIAFWFGHVGARHTMFQGIHGLNNDEDDDDDAEVEEITKDDFELGQTVKFLLKDKIITGKIEKLNPKRAKVNTGTDVYNVPYPLLK